MITPNDNSPISESMMDSENDQGNTYVKGDYVVRVNQTTTQESPRSEIWRFEGEVVDKEN